MSLSESQSHYLTETGDRTWEVIYDRKSILSWLSTVESEPSTSSEASPILTDAQDFNYHWSAKGGFMATQDLKRKQLGHTSISSQSSEGSPQKRQRKGSEQSSALDPDNQTMFMPPPQPPSSNRSPSPERNLVIALKGATPPFQFHTLEETKGLPTGVSAAEAHMSAVREDLIPNGLKERLHSIDRTTKQIPETSYNRDVLSSEQLESLWHIVYTTHRKTATARKYLEDENAWNVILFCLVNWVVSKGAEIIDIKNIQSQLIDKPWHPRLASGVTLSKKADYALCFSIYNPEVEDYYEKLSVGGQTLLLSHMTGAFCSRLLFFCGIEVKSDENNKSKEALPQLAVWMGAGLLKLEDLSLQTTKKPIELLPLVGFTVVGHIWNMYLGYKDPGPGKAIHILGPLQDEDSLNTRTWLGVFKLISLLEKVESYGCEIYWPWLKREILDPLIRKGEGKASTTLSPATDNVDSIKKQDGNGVSTAPTSAPEQSDLWIQQKQGTA